MKISVKNMVCPRCVESVGNVLSELNLEAESIELGEVVLNQKPDQEQLNELDNKLKSVGFELILDRETAITVQIKSALIGYLSHLELEKEPQKVSAYLSSRLNYNYSYLSNLFSEKQNQTIESFLIRLKVERAKELLSYKKWTLSEIAWKLKYSSVQYLSNQFKKVTGQTVTEYLKAPKKKRIPLDQL
jgi:AraC family transcriptional regulator